MRREAASPRGGKSSQCEARLPSEERELWLEVSPISRRRILLAALEAFSSQGYHPTTTREIAHRVGMSPSALYVHYESKADLLYAISMLGYQDLADSMSSANDGPDVAANLFGAVYSFVQWNAQNYLLSSVMQASDDALTGPPKVRIARLHRIPVDIFRDLLTSGTEEGAFVAEQVDENALAIAALGYYLPTWWGSRPSGVDPDAIASTFAASALRLAGAPPTLP